MSTPFNVTRHLSFESNIDPGPRRGVVEIALVNDQPIDTKIKLAAGMSSGVLHRVTMVRVSGADAGTIDTTIFTGADDPPDPANELSIIFQDTNSVVPNTAGEQVFSEELLEHDFVTQGNERGEVIIRLQQSISQTATYRIEIAGDGKH